MSGFSRSVGKGTAAENGIAGFCLWHTAGSPCSDASHVCLCMVVLMLYLPSCLHACTEFHVDSDCSRSSHGAMLSAGQLLVGDVGWSKCHLHSSKSTRFVL